MRYYAYALIDPSNNNQPFYIGKGLDNRLQSHFKEAIAISTNAIDSIIEGCDTKSIMTHAENRLNKTAYSRQKSKKIEELLAIGYNHTHISRVIAKKLDESTALAVEACLIRSVYGIENLTNLAEGEHSERFRPYNVWNYIKGFDLDYLNQGLMSSGLEHKLGKYYVYVLLDPKSKEVFYVGKGMGNRLIDHFEKSSNLGAAAADADRLSKIRQLLGYGFLSHDIGRIVARVAEESHAFALEALFLKFVFGLESLANIQPGHHSDNFRAKNDWEIRIGFDRPNVATPGVRGDRSEKLDGMLGEGLGSPLMEVQNAFPNLVFDPPKVLDASDLSIEADVGKNRNQTGARIKIFIRRTKIQIELRHRNKSQHQWIIAHFTRLGAYPLRRADDVFFPDKWRGSKNMAKDVREAVRRVNLLLEIVSAQTRSALSPEALSLLEGLPKK